LGGVMGFIFGAVVEGGGVWGGSDGGGGGGGAGGFPERGCAEVCTPNFITGLGFDFL